MKRWMGLLPLLLTALLARGATVTVDADTRYQVIEGWGTCLVDWDASMPYTTTAWRVAYRDLGCNILRMAMVKEVLADPSGDLRIPVPLADNLQSNVNRMNFNITSSRVFGQMAAWLAAYALETNRVKITGAFWSPPHWMKGPTGKLAEYVGQPSAGQWPTPWMSGDHSYGADGTGASIGGRLLQDTTNLTQFARYVTAWVQGFRQRWGVPVYAISLQNEISFENPFDSCTYATGPGTTNAPGAGSQHWQYAAALKAVKDEFQHNGITVKIKGPHCAGVKDTPQSPWELNDQMKYIKAVKQYSDTTLITFMDFYNSNGYIGSDSNAVFMLEGYWKGTQNVPANWIFWTDAPGVMNDGKRTWFSECGGEEAAWLNGSGGTPGTGALVLPLKMHNALVHGNISAYIHWQMTDGSASETVHTLLGTSNINTPHNSKKYCAYKHFSRYVRPGATRVKALFENGAASLGGQHVYDTYHSLNVSAFVHTQDWTVTMVLVNMRASNETVTINVPTNQFFAQTYQVYRTSSSDSFARQGDLTVVNGQVTPNVPAYSVVTLHGMVPEPAALWLGCGCCIVIRVRR